MEIEREMEDPYAYEGEYDEMDAESMVLHGMDEEAEMDESEKAFLRGYLGMGEA